MVVEANENKVLASIETKETYYPFGFESNFSIYVMKCFSAPSHYVYRMMNKDWVKILTHDLIKDTKFQEILAIVMPIDEKLQRPLQTFTKDQISSATYWIISGQHSIVAAKRLQNSNLDKVSNQLRQQFRYRRCKILLDCPPKLSREISKDANISVAKSMQEEPFLDHLLQARSQWIANGRPNVGKSKQTAEVADIENKNDGDEMILEGDMQVEEQVFTRGEKEKGGNEFDVGSNVATTHPHLEELQPHSSSQKSDTCQKKFDDGFNGQKRDATKLFKSPIVDRVEADSRDCWNMLQPPQLNTLFTIDGMKFEIKTSTIPNVGYGLFAHDNIRESQFLMYYIGIKLDYDSWKTMCAKNPRVKMYSIVEDPNVDKDEDLLYVYGDVNMGNVAGYINSSIYCRHRENVEYQLYPGISPWKTFKQDLVDSKEFGYIGIHATRNINIGEELLCYYNF
ncbi:hypothetical protein L7F22_048106 [Adiantum nelumboides]|nr:hypothetical protein [Adiantum nelumboides]